MGKSYICVGDNPTNPLSTGNSCSSPFYDGGFITVNLTGRYVFIYRAGVTCCSFYVVASVDLYETTNLVGLATVLTD